MSGFLNIDDTNYEEYCVIGLEDVDEVMKTMRMEGESPIDDEIEPIETFVEFGSATNFKGFEALHNIFSTSTTNHFALVFKRILYKCMMNCNDHFRCFNKMLTN